VLYAAKRERGERGGGEKEIRIPCRHREAALPPDISFSGSLTSGEFSFRVCARLSKVIFLPASATLEILILNLSS